MNLERWRWWSTMDEARYWCFPSILMDEAASSWETFELEDKRAATVVLILFFALEMNARQRLTVLRKDRLLFGCKQRKKSASALQASHGAPFLHNCWTKPTIVMDFLDSTSQLVSSRRSPGFGFIHRRPTECEPRPEQLEGERGRGKLLFERKIERKNWWSLRPFDW